MDICETALRKKLEALKAEWGCVVLMEVKTGEIKAMCNLKRAGDENYYELANHAVTRMEPGSTFKIITLAASIEENTVDLINDTFHDGGSVNVDGARIKCWKKGGHGSQTFLNVVENSCNLGVYTRTFISL